jgi:hypothetical protein
MNETIKRMGIVSGVIAFAFCLGAGLWILSKVGFDHSDDVVSTGLALYFIGKAFFVGPMLVIASLQSRRNGKE